MPNLGNQKIGYSWKELLNNTQQPPLDPFALAISEFSVALYTLHLNQPVLNTYDISAAQKIFESSINKCSQILDAMEYYIKAKTCYFGDKSAFSLSTAGQKFFQLIHSPFDFKVSQCSPGTDALAVQAICNCLDAHGREGSKLLSNYQKPYLALLEKTVDLSEPQFIDRFNEVVRMSVDHELSTRRGLPFFKAWWPDAYFTLVADPSCDLVANLTCRTPHAEKNEALLYLNGEKILSLETASKWIKKTFTIEKSRLVTGFNRVQLKWPPLPESEGSIISTLSRRYVRGHVIDIFPVFGEVFSFTLQRKFSKEAQNL